MYITTKKQKDILLVSEVQRIFQKVKNISLERHFRLKISLTFEIQTDLLKSSMTIVNMYMLTFCN